MKFDSKSRTLQSFPVLIFLIVVIIIINGCFFSVTLKHADQVRNDIMVNAIDDRWEIVKNEIEYQYSLSSADIKYLSKRIECEILRQYAGNMESLKEDFENDTLGDKLFDIFKQYLQNDASSPNNATTTDDYNYVLGFKSKIFSIFSSSANEDYSSLKTWSEYFNASANVALNESLVSNIVNRNLSETLLMYQTGNLSANTHVVSSHNVDALELLFKERGLVALKEIEFVNVAYITENGDIFGTHDYMYLDSIPNYKMILVGTSNIYDTIYPVVKNKLEIYDIETNNMLNDISEAVTRKCLEFVTVTLTLLALIVVFGGFYNKDIQKSE